MSTNNNATKPVFVIDLDAPVPDFPVTVTLPLLHGGEGQIIFICRHHTKTDWAAIKDADYIAKDNARADREAAIEAISAEIKQRGASADPPTPFDRAAFTAEYGESSIINDTLKSSAELVLKFAKSWNLTNPLTAESLIKLENKHGGTLARCFEAYQIAIYQGRLGN